MENVKSFVLRLGRQSALTVFVQRLFIVQHTTAIDKTLQIGRDSGLCDDVLLELTHSYLRMNKFVIQAPLNYINPNHLHHHRPKSRDPASPAF